MAKIAGDVLAKQLGSVNGATNAALKKLVEENYKEMILPTLKKSKADDFVFRHGFEASINAKLEAYLHLDTKASGDKEGISSQQKIASLEKQIAEERAKFQAKLEALERKVAELEIRPREGYQFPAGTVETHTICTPQ